MIDRMITSLLSATLMLSCSAPSPESLPSNPSETGGAPSSTSPTEVAADPLPEAIGDRVKADLAEHLSVSVDRLTIDNYSGETWSDGCLGLGGPAESCLAALTPGWQVNLTDTLTNETYTYRTNLSGDQIRRDDSDAASLPESVSDRIFEAAQAAGLSPSESLGIIAADAQTWNGCYGLAAADEACTMIAIPGWRVVISDGNQYWVYHTDSTGDTVRLNETASGSEIPPSFIAMVNPFELGDETSVQYTIRHESGMQETFMLEATGQLMYIQQQGGTVVRRDSRPVSEAAGQTLLEQFNQFNFAHLDGIRYQPVVAGLEPVSEPMMTLTTRSGTVEYVESESDALPENLQAIVQEWSAMIAAFDSE